MANFVRRIVTWLACAVCVAAAADSGQAKAELPPGTAEDRTSEVSPIILANETVALEGRSAAGGRVQFPSERQDQGRHAGSHDHALWQSALYATADVHVPAVSRRACQLYPDRGPCSGTVRAWYWDSGNEKCSTFVYGGCKGNDNNFITEDECRSVCDIGYRQKVTGHTGFLPRPVSTDDLSYPASSSQRYPAVGNALTSPSHHHFSDHRPDFSVRPEYPPFAPGHAQVTPLEDYRPYPQSSGTGTQRYPQSSRPGTQPYPQSSGTATQRYPQFSSAGTTRYPQSSGPGVQRYPEPSIAGDEGPRHPGLLRPHGCSEEEAVCEFDHYDYPSSTMDLLFTRYGEELRQMYHQLYQFGPEEFTERYRNLSSEAASARSEPEALTARHGAGEFVCESEVHYRRPGWARTFAGAWQLIINTAAFPQAVRIETCRYEGLRCNFLPPCMSSLCVQRFAVVKMLCVNPLNPFARPGVQDVEIPSGCSCYVTGDRGAAWRQPWVRSEDTPAAHARSGRTATSAADD